jgi:hypothetical protein
MNLSIKTSIILSVIMLSVTIVFVTLNVIIVSAYMLSVVMQNAVVPFCHEHNWHIQACLHLELTLSKGFDL